MQARPKLHAQAGERANSAQSVSRRLDSFLATELSVVADMTNLMWKLADKRPAPQSETLIRNMLRAAGLVLADYIAADDITPASEAIGTYQSALPSSP